jgi:hypothetical protein
MRLDVAWLTVARLEERRLLEKTYKTADGFVTLHEEEQRPGKVEKV